MNTITNAERAEIQATANEIVRLDDEWRVSNFQQSVDALMKAHGISRQRANGHIAKAARRIRYKASIPPGWISVEEAADRAPFSRRTVKRAIQVGKIEAVEFPVRAVKIASLEEWISDASAHKAGRPFKKK